MKTIVGIDDRIEHFVELPKRKEGEPEPLPNPTFRKLFIDAVGAAVTSREPGPGQHTLTGSEAIDLWKLGVRLKDGPTDFVVNSDELKLLKEWCGRNQPGWFAYIFGQVMHKLESAQDFTSNGVAKS